MQTTAQFGKLYVVATPIGNLEDITLRAIRVLGEVDFVAAEDTRCTRKLLSHLSIRKPMLSYYKDKEVSRSQQIIDEIAKGHSVALVSDAGTPCISDPGSILVKKCRDHGITVVPVPGPSALTAFLSIGGYVFTSFTFLGFLPSKGSERKKILKSYAQHDMSFVFYESPRRIVKTLQQCNELLGDRDVIVGRELTKVYEEVLHGHLSTVIETLGKRDSIKGEFVVAVTPGDDIENPPEANLYDLLCWYRDNSAFSMKDSVKKISKDLNLSKSQVYQLALDVWHKS